MALESEPSVIPGIVLSDLSIVEEGTQKRSIVGCFDQFAFDQFPANYHRFFITAWVTNIEGALTEMELTTRIEQKGSAHVVFSSSAKMALGGERTFDRRDIIAFSIAVPTITFPTPGLYTVLILFSGEEVGRRDVNVMQRPK
jgi:hypothetical protein